MILTRKSYNCTGTAFVQGDSAGGSKIIEQTLLWNFVFELYNEFFDRFSVCESLKVGTILPLFKGKGVKANNRDNYRGTSYFL